jgi:HK97 family phage portal protein
VPTLGQFITGLFRRSIAPEGEPRPGPYAVTNPTGILPDSWGKYWNYWQMGYDPLAGAPGSAVVEACVAAYSQTIAMCPGDHWWGLENGGRERVTTSALSRILRKPNDYQSRSDFILNLARDLYRDGNSYALAERNDRSEVSAFHPFDPLQSKPVIGEDGSVFYSLAGNNVIDRSLDHLGARTAKGLLVPARNVLHVKLEPESAQPLLGIPPARHAAAAVTAQRAIGSQLINFFSNMNRPSGVVETEQNLSPQQTAELRTAINKAWQGVDDLSGGPPVLTNGFKFKAISMSGKDSAVADVAKLTLDEIMMVYGVPPAILGMAGSSFASTEALMQFWLARGLGFAINHIEVAFDHFFGLRGWPDEYVEMDTRALLRVAYKDRIEALARGVQTGIYSPNDARNAEDLEDVANGDQPRVQQQQVPLDWGGFKVQPAPAAGTVPAPDAEPPSAPSGGDEPTEGEDEKSLILAFDRGDTSHVVSRTAA